MVLRATEELFDGRRADHGGGGSGQRSGTGSARAQQYPGVVAYSGGRRSERGVAAALARDFVRESVDAMR